MSIFPRRASSFNPAEVWNQFRRQLWAEFYAELYPDDSLPKQWEFEVASYLFERNYHVDSIRAVLESTAAWGTAELCRELQFDDQDRARVERLLPETPSHQWARLDDYHWTTTGDRT